MFGFTVVFDTQQMLPQHWLQKYSGLKTMYVYGIESLLLGRMSLSYGADLFCFIACCILCIYEQRYLCQSSLFSGHDSMAVLTFF